jgi:hypothetical protein
VIVTVCGELSEPAAGENDGVAAAGSELIVSVCAEDVEVANVPSPL